MKETLSTAAVAEKLRVEQNTIIAGLCRNGHYLGLRPVKLPNRRLLWSAEAVDQLIARCGDAASTEARAGEK